MKTYRPSLRNSLGFAIPSLCLALFAASQCAQAEPIDDVLLDIAVAEDRRESTPELRKLVTHESPTVRGRVALALGRIGNASDVRVAASLLADPSPDVRRWAAFGLGEMEDSTAAFALEALLLSGNEEDPEVRELAVEGLGKLRRGAEACRAALRDGDDRVQTEALYAAWKIPVVGAEEEVLQLTGHKLVRVRAAATYCLMRLSGAPASGRTPIPGGTEISAELRKTIEARLLAVSYDKDPRVQLPAIRGLRRSFQPEVTARLAELLESEDWRIQVEALRALSTADDESTRSVSLSAIEKLTKNENSNVALSAIAAFSTLGSDEEAESILLQFLKAPLPRVRVVALETYLARTAPGPNPDTESETDLSSSVTATATPEFVVELEQLTKDRNWFVRAACVDAAARLPEGPGRTLLRHLSGDEGRVAKLAAAPYLQVLFDSDTGPILPRLEPELNRLLEHEDPMVPLVAIDKVSTFFAPEDTLATPATEEEWQEFAELLAAVRQRALSRPSWIDVRQTIVAAAATPGTNATMQELLLASCDDPSYTVRKDAVAACEELEIKPPREAGPVEPNFTRAELGEILQWTRTDRIVQIETTAGTLEARLFLEDAPLTCWNFATLANAGFYDQGNWHRVVSNFVLQDGCPRGDGWGGPDHQIRCEVNRHRYTRGALGMALAGKDTGGSQFFFTHSEQPHLNGGYTVFGEILRGQRIADLVTQGDPITRIRVIEG